MGIVTKGLGGKQLIIKGLADELAQYFADEGITQSATADNRTTLGVVNESTRTTLGIEDEIILALQEEIKRSRRNRKIRERIRREAIMRDDEEIMQIVAALMGEINGVLV